MRTDETLRSFLPAAVLAVGLLAAVLSSCGGGSDLSRRASATCGDPGDLENVFCVVTCNLGCNQSGCTISEIAVNQPLILHFNQDVDPRSVHSGSVVLKTDDGREPVGDFLTQGATLFFLPEVRTVGGRTFFGFEQGRTYRLTLPGGPDAVAPLRAASGDRLGGTLSCLLNVTLGVVDMDGRPPDATLIVPTRSIDVAVDTEIVLQFSELIDESPFFGAEPGEEPVQFRVIPTDGQGNCGERLFRLEGTTSLSTDRLNMRTILRFRPAALLPGMTCVRVEVTSRVRDLSNKPAVPRRFEFRTREMPVVESSVTEDFATSVRQDSAATGARWGDDRLLPGVVGGTGLHGAFRASDGRFLGMDGNMAVYEWSTDNQVIPGTQTLTGQDETVTDGVFSFSSFAVARDERVVFRGERPARIHVRGRVDLQGEVVVSGEDASNSFSGEENTGQPGTRGGAGGGRGGDGANRPDRSAPRKVDGSDGEDIRLPPGHPYAASAAGTGGRGSKAVPPGANPAQICYLFFGILTTTTAGGGGGGSLYKTPGEEGRFVLVNLDLGPTNPPLDPCEQGPGGAGGSLLFETAGTPVAESTFQFLIGGAGGGGGGTNPHGSAESTPPPRWHSGCGGGGGGGGVLLRAGGSFNMASSGKILARGGSSAHYPAPPIQGRPTTGGGGSGGTILVQVGGAALPVLSGALDVRGGTGGRRADLFPQRNFASQGGDGGPGYVRVETSRALGVSEMGVVQPPATADNTGVLQDRDMVTGAQSLWYGTGHVFPPEFVRYEIEAEEGGRRVVYSDDPARGVLPRLGVTPFAFYLQTAMVDPRLEPDPLTLSKWTTTTEELNRERGTGVRWVLLFDRERLGTSVDLVVHEVRVVVRG